jgi:hypothetical protein
MPEGFSMANARRRYRFSLPGLWVDLESASLVVSPPSASDSKGGKIESEGGKFESAQLVTLAFVASMLYLMVQPRPVASDDDLAKAKKVSDEMGKKSASAAYSPM